MGVGRFVGGGDQRFQRSLFDGFAVAKNALIDERQQRVENCRAGFPDLVEEGKFGLWEIAFRLAYVMVFFQGLDGNRAEDFFGGAETVHQVFEVGGALEGAGDASGDQALGGAGRPVQEGVLSAQCAEQGNGDDFFSFEHVGADCGHQRLDSVLQFHGTTCFWDACLCSGGRGVMCLFQWHLAASL